jgi:prolyl-tRNA editing enzyme YbaK/EbsC (Cys-tRNA(Pro) deacylase)
MHGNAHLGERHHRHGRVIETDDRYIQSRRCVLEPQPTTSQHASESNHVTDNPRVERVRRALAGRGYAGEIRVFETATRTAAQAAQACGCEIGAIANSLVFRCDDRPLLILTSGAHRVDVRYVQRQLGSGKLHRADAAFVLEHTGQVIGGVAPLGHIERIPTILDMDLSQYPEIWAAAGHPNTVFRTNYDYLLSVTQATAMAVAQE